ncbi:MAG: hypothetical protein KKE30_00920 [Gammaproteobacteria bacterium]|nr:hypothetical protein [Gammaproteobacteria bacterium]MBU1556410.1 hypothetical protein [Gammaproteobacteria bacterium]MBU2072006.1 hypothetical protein [Gammaproteobacteria bacterium]MBU2183909.1 hypothetical protein [Gammaproteobacteria bacterium]MBU2203337.1 hypothetical protein [Gammaproteobacteria bacterium]
MNSKFFFVVFPLISSFPCFSDTYYAGIDYTMTGIELSGEKAKPDATAIRLGASNNNMALEVQYLTSNETDNIYNMKFDLEQSVGLYFVMQSGITDGYGLNISLGYAMNEMAVSGPSNTYNGKDQYDGFSWRIALLQQIPYLERTQVRLAYQSLYKDSDIEITGISLGITYQF